MGYNGRRKIYTLTEEITSDNIIGVLNKALATHMKNVEEMDYLYD